MIHSLEALDLNKSYSYADYLTWQFTERVELLKGYIRQMAAPSPKHQKVSIELGTEMKLFFRKHGCEMFYAPFDVRLYDRSKSGLADRDIYTVVQPDICVVCDPAKIDNKGCNGSPDLVVEILSPGNPGTDLKDKYELYQENGVGEYWIVYPNDAVLHQFVLRDDKYVPHGVYTRTDTLTSFLFPGLSVPLGEVFAEPR